LERARIEAGSAELFDPDGILFLSFEDLQGTWDAIVFPEVYRQSKSLISSTKPFLLTGRMEMDAERGEAFLRVEKVVPVT
jgi:DNA polymerase III alpha subunit